jgi:hypothetical protein
MRIKKLENLNDLLIFIDEQQQIGNDQIISKLRKIVNELFLQETLRMDISYSDAECIGYSIIQRLLSTTE